MKQFYKQLLPRSPRTKAVLDLHGFRWRDEKKTEKLAKVGAQFLIQSRSGSYCNIRRHVSYPSAPMKNLCPTSLTTPRLRCESPMERKQTNKRHHRFSVTKVIKRASLHSQTTWTMIWRTSIGRAIDNGPGRLSLYLSLSFSLFYDNCVFFCLISGRGIVSNHGRERTRTNPSQRSARCLGPIQFAIGRIRPLRIGLLLQQGLLHRKQFVVLPTSRKRHFRRLQHPCGLHSAFRPCKVIRWSSDRKWINN